MKISRKTDYGIHALMILTKYRNREMSVKEMAEMQNISSSYLAKVMQKLVGAGLVNSSEGKGGGYTLACPPDEIKIADVFRVMEGNEIFDCVDYKRGCTIRGNCKIQQAIEDSYQAMLEELSRTSIREILPPRIGE